MSKKFHGSLCVYCVERPSTTPDHVFAREFFLPSQRQNLPKVPACSKCNNDKSKLEHYLTAVLRFGGRHATASENLALMVPKRLAKNNKLYVALTSGQRILPVRSETGVAVQRLTIPVDKVRLEELFGMIARALLWHHWQVHVPKGYLIDSNIYTAADARRT